MRSDFRRADLKKAAQRQLLFFTPEQAESLLSMADRTRRASMKHD